MAGTLEKKYNKKETGYLYWPVYFRGSPKEYHVTCKWLGDTKHTVEIITELLSGISTKAPDPDLVAWVPTVFDTKNDGHVKVLVLENCPQSMYDCHDALAVIRRDDYPDYQPHITISGHAWDMIKSESVTPQDLGISFGPLTLKSGGKVTVVGYDLSEE